MPMKLTLLVAQFVISVVVAASPLLAEDGNRFTGEYETAPGILPQLGA
jgi:hypothetical protein